MFLEGQEVNRSTVSGRKFKNSFTTKKKEK